MNQIFTLFTTALIASAIAEAPFRSQLQALPNQDSPSSGPYPASAPYPAPAPYPARVVVPHSEYGPPEVKVVPAQFIKTEYTYDIPETPKPSLPYPHLVPVLTGPYSPRVVVPQSEYGPPEVKVVPAQFIKTEYTYDIPETAKPSLPYPHLVPVLTGPYKARVVVPHSEYGPPEVKVVPAPIIKTEYTYDIPETPKPSLPYPQVLTGPYSARVVVPHSEYGPPEVKVVPAPIIKTEYTYDIPETPKPSLPYPQVLTGPYSARVVVPHSEYGPPEVKVVPAPIIKTEYTYDIPETAKPSLPYPHLVPVLTGPYKARVVVPHSEYGPPEVKVVPAPIIKTEYTYDIPETPKPSLPYPPAVPVPTGPYPVRVVVPHQEYGLPETKLVVPHSEYGPPEVRLVPAVVVKTEYAYEIPQTPAPTPAPYPARVVLPVVPHQEYGPPAQTGPYPARVVVPHSEYAL